MCASESNKEVKKTEQVDNMCFAEAVYDEEELFDYSLYVEIV